MCTVWIRAGGNGCADRHLGGPVLADRFPPGLVWWVRVESGARRERFSLRVDWKPLWDA
jgi:hypothetical protein